MSAAPDHIRLPCARDPRRPTQPTTGAVRSERGVRVPLHILLALQPNDWNSPVRARTARRQGQDNYCAKRARRITDSLLLLPLPLPNLFRLSASCCPPVLVSPALSVSLIDTYRRLRCYRGRHRRTKWREGGERYEITPWWSTRRAGNDEDGGCRHESRGREQSRFVGIFSR